MPSLSEVELVFKDKSSVKVHTGKLDFNLIENTEKLKPVKLSKLGEYAFSLGSGRIFEEDYKDGNYIESEDNKYNFTFKWNHPADTTITNIYGDDEYKIETNNTKIPKGQNEEIKVSIKPKDRKFGIERYKPIVEVEIDGEKGILKQDEIIIGYELSDEVIKKYKENNVFE